MRRIAMLFAMFIASSACFAGEKTMELLSDKSLENYGWTFDNGQEFPGAKGKLSVDAAEKDALRLDGDFTVGEHDFLLPRNIFAKVPAQCRAVELYRSRDARGHARGNPEPEQCKLAG